MQTSLISEMKSTIYKYINITLDTGIAVKNKTTFPKV